MHIQSRRRPSHFANVIARKPGSRPERLVLCAHFDTKAHTPGAFDNGSGVAVLLALAELFARQLTTASLEFVAFNGEEVGGVGDTVYHRQLDDPAHILAVINIDGVGQRLALNSITMLAHSAASQTRVGRIVERYPGVVWTDPWVESNHSGFIWRGIPAVALTALGGGAVSHGPADTLEWLSPDKLQETAALAAEIVEALSAEPVGWYRENPVIS